MVSQAQVNTPLWYQADLLALHTEFPAYDFTFTEQPNIFSISLEKTDPECKVPASHSMPHEPKNNEE
ncbi:MAG: hypothetical protein D3917_14170 [Candidatus Electrothrix sp. AX5]|nr:hypothetical protein [Candidatus Electrothrix sp. AX5]